MAWERTSVGLDVHARSVVAGVLDVVTGELWSRRLPAATEAVVAWTRSLPGPVAVAYEAGPTGFGLARALEQLGVRCVVVAPSKLERPAGDRVKTDRRDAERLARLLHIGELPAVRVPTVAEEAARDLVRAREDARADLMRARHRLSKLLLGQGLVLDGAAWTQAHGRWLASVAAALTQPGLRVAVDEAQGAVLAVQARRDRLDAAIAELAATPPWAPGVARLGCLGGGRGADRVRVGGRGRRLASLHRSHDRGLAGLGSKRAVQRRPAHPGLDHQDRQPPCSPVAGRGGLAPPQTLSAQQELQARHAGQPAAVREHADRGNHRLHQRWCRLDARAKRSTSAWSRSPASWLDGVGAWPSWTPDPAARAGRWARPASARATRDTPMSSQPTNGSVTLDLLDQRTAPTHPGHAVTNPRISV
jgi:transposase